MSSTPPQDPARATTRGLLAASAFWIGLIVSVAALYGMSRPSTDFEIQTAVEFTIAPSDVREETGHCYLARFTEEGIASSADGNPSKLVLLEDGQPLIVDDLHSNIRAEGAGRYSHWGDNIYFSASDNSDPRSNGRQYTLTLPQVRASAWKDRLPMALGAGLALALLGLLLLPRVSRVVLVGALVLIVVRVQDAPLTTFAMASNMADAGARLFGATDGKALPVARAASAGNVSRLELSDFQSFEDTPPRLAEPVELEIARPDCATSQGREVLLSEIDCAMPGTTAQGMLATQLAEIVVVGRFLQGQRVEFEVRDPDGRPIGQRLQIPVATSPEPQTLRIVQPLGVFHGGSDVLVGGVAVMRPWDDIPVLCEITSMSLIDADQAYAANESGQEVFLHGSLRPAVWQSRAGRFRAEVPARSGALLKGSLGLRHRMPGASATAEVIAHTSDGAEITLYTGRVDASDEWLSVRATLADVSGTVTHLELRCADLPAGGVLAWAGWRLVDTSRPPQRVFVTLMDTLRADALRCYDDGAAATPHLDALAEDGALFENCYSQCFWTRPSIASIMTSRYVHATGIHGTSHRLPDSYLTLPEVFAQNGFYTVGTVSNTNAASSAGLEQGWDEFAEELVTDSNSLAGDYCSTLVEPRLLELLEEDLLVYVHLMDAHGPYGPPEQPEGWSTPAGVPLEFDRFLDRPWLEQPTDTARRELYREDVRALDAGWGAFLERMLTRWERDDAPAAIVAVLSDHGEFLGEHDRWSHSDGLMFPEVTHVPLILRAPGRIQPGTRVSSVVENLDLAPTLLALAGLAAPARANWDGRDLMPALEGDDRDVGQALASAGDMQRQFAYYADDGSAIGQGGQLAAHGSGDLADAPLSPSLLDELVTERLRAAFVELWQVYLDAGNEITAEFWTDEDALATVLDPEALQQLAEMGYLER